MNAEKLKKMQAEVRIGGKGTPRRKKKILKKTAATDDKKLQSSLKKLSVNTIPGIEEVNMIKDDGTVIHFNNPKAQASLAANTFAITGHAENKQIAEMLPGILTQLGPEGLNQLKRLASNVVVGNKLLSSVNEEDDVPNLVENFEDASKKEIESIQKNETPKTDEQKPPADAKSSLIEESTKLLAEKLKIDEKEPVTNTEKVVEPEVAKPIIETNPAETPKTDAPKVEVVPTIEPVKEVVVLQAEAPKVDAPKTEVSKSEETKKEAPKPEAAKKDAPKPEAAKKEAPKPEAAKKEAPKPDAVKTETAKEQPKVDDKKKTESKKPEGKGNKKVDDKNKKNKNQKKDN